MANFKPTKKKTIITIALLVGWFLLLFIFRPMCSCVMGGFEGCIDYEFLALIHIGCHCGCTALGTALLLDLIFLLPGILFYIIYSINERKK